MVRKGPELPTLLAKLDEAANSSGGWSYEQGKASRIEPTCWALLALESQTASPSRLLHKTFLDSCQRASGALVENQQWPVNISFNALAAFTWANRTSLVAEQKLRTLFGWLVATKGVQTVQSSSYRQDNS